MSGTGMQLHVFLQELEVVAGPHQRLEQEVVAGPHQRLEPEVVAGPHQRLEPEVMVVEVAHQSLEVMEVVEGLHFLLANSFCIRRL